MADFNHLPANFNSDRITGFKRVGDEMMRETSALPTTDSSHTRSIPMADIINVGPSFRIAPHARVDIEIWFDLATDKLCVRRVKA
jgi:hypothetical protein